MSDSVWGQGNDSLSGDRFFTQESLDSSSFSESSLALQEPTPGRKRGLYKCLHETLEQSLDTGKRMNCRAESCDKGSRTLSGPRKDRDWGGGGGKVWRLTDVGTSTASLFLLSA